MGGTGVMRTHVKDQSNSLHSPGVNKTLYNPDLALGTGWSFTRQLGLFARYQTFTPSYSNAYDSSGRSTESAGLVTVGVEVHF